MRQTSPFVITISRQLGSGGAYMGQQLAKNLNVFYADREIIGQAAKQLSVLEDAKTLFKINISLTKKLFFLYSL